MLLAGTSITNVSSLPDHTMKPPIFPKDHHACAITWATARSLQWPCPVTQSSRSSQPGSAAGRAAVVAAPRRRLLQINSAARIRGVGELRHSRTPARPRTALHGPAPATDQTISRLRGGSGNIWWRPRPGEMVDGKLENFPLCRFAAPSKHPDKNRNRNTISKETALRELLLNQTGCGASPHHVVKFTFGTTCVG